MLEEKERIRVLFGRNLKAIREKKGLSLLDLSYLCTINDSNLSKYENAKREPVVSTVFELAKALKIHPKELLDLGIDYTYEND